MIDMTIEEILADHTNDNYRPAVLDSISTEDFSNFLRRIELENIEESFIKIVADHLGIEKDTITASKKLVDDLGADSLDLVELIMEAEERWFINFEDDELRDDNCTVGDFVTKIREKVDAKQAQPTKESS